MQKGFRGRPGAAVVSRQKAQAEHYAKLVSNYLAAGIVAPISRKPASQ